MIVTELIENVVRDFVTPVNEEQTESSMDVEGACKSEHEKNLEPQSTSKFDSQEDELEVDAEYANYGKPIHAAAVAGHENMDLAIAQSRQDIIEFFNVLLPTHNSILEGVSTCSVNTRLQKEEIARK